MHPRPDPVPDSTVSRPQRSGRSLRPSARWLLHILIGGALAACAGESSREASDAPDKSHPDEEGAAPASRPRAPAGPGARVVTLITGDRVIVQASGVLTPEAAPGRRRVAFRTMALGKHRFVIPLDALGLVASGRVDRRLFDITALLELRYDDASRPDLPLIVKYGPARRSAARSALTAAGVPAGRALASIDGEGVRVPKAAVHAAWSAMTGGVSRGSSLAAGGVDRIWLDGVRKTTLDHSVPQIGGPVAWSAGYTGLGVTVAVLDTGIADHPDFAGRIADARSFVEGYPEPLDGDGHGTHVASIAAGSGAGQDGLYRGVAPDADLLIGKVCDDFGTCFDSDIIAGLEWAAQSGAAVINLSLGGEDTEGVDPLEEAINTLTAQQGVLVVAAAGNDGTDLPVSSPSTADAALSVGAVDADDELAYFSSHGPRVGDSGLKPEITAPGAFIVAARAAGTPTGDVDPVNDLYTRLSGTSMATPHVTGAAALLAQQHPEWRAEELKAALMGSAEPHPVLDVFAQGAGRIDVGRAIGREVIASPASLSLGLALWPHDDDPVIERVVSYTNSGASPIDLLLAFDVVDGDGAPAPAGMFIAMPGQVTVPAGGQAQVTVAAHSAVPGPTGLYTGALVATSGDQALRTLLSLSVEEESYDLQLDYVYRDPEEGAPSFAAGFLLDIDDGDFIDIPAAMDSTALRAPRGRYHLHADVLGGDSGIPDPTVRGYDATFVQPLLDLDRDMTLTLDARTARATDVTVPNASARRVEENWIYRRETALVSLFTGTGWSRHPDEVDYSPIYTQHLGPDVSESDFWMTYGGTWAQPGPPTEDWWRYFENTPFAYHIDFIAGRGRFPSGITWHIETSDLATVDVRHVVDGPATLVNTHSLARRVDIPLWAFIAPITIPIQGPPTRRTEYYATGPEIGWFPSAAEWDTSDEENQDIVTYWWGNPQTFEPGRRYRRNWARGVIGPNVAADLEGDYLDEGLGIFRNGDSLAVVILAMFADSDGHFGESFQMTGRGRLYRDGVLLEEAGPDFAFYDLAPEPARYRLETEAQRASRAESFPEVRIAWEFDSAHVPETERSYLPLFSMTFAPKLDDHNRAPAGRLFVIPFSFSRQPEATASPIERASVDVSYDAGETWKKALVIRLGDVGLAVVRHPDEEARVSLRANATAEDGTVMEQTIIEGYALRD